MDDALSKILNNDSTNRLGFSIVLDEDGDFAVRFNSGINYRNPNIFERTVPEDQRQSILDAIMNDTGKNAYSAQ